MKLVVGLGNPGVRYEGTRHNLGFLAVKGFAKENGFKFAKKEFNSYYAKGCGAVLVLPLTYMNLTGPAVLNFLNKYKCSASDLLVVCDDIALPLGSLRLKASGSSGGHNGLKSIIGSIKTENFSRLRLGIARDGFESRDVDLKEYVLDKFNRSELKQAGRVVETAGAVISEWLAAGTEKAMAKFNKKGVGTNA